MAKLPIDAKRLNARLHETCEFGQAFRYGDEAHETGMNRLALNSDDKLVRDWFASTMTGLGCRVTVDKMGVQRAVRSGKRKGPPIALGSHLDTQPSGGRYDGILGVHAAIEAISTLVEHNIQTEHDVAVINWTNEEGARFPRSVIASAVWAGQVPLQDAHALEDVADSKLTLKSELEKTGYLGDRECSWESEPLRAHFELHIEQGPILEQKQLRIGVVSGGQSYAWYTIRLQGKACHTGTTPFENRADALLCSSMIQVAANQIAKKHGGLASTGILTLQPGSVNVCPESVKMSLDIRHMEDVKREAIAKEVFAEIERIAREGQGQPVKVDVQTDTISPAVRFHPDCVQAVKQAAIDHVGESWLEMRAGAGHDSFMTNTRCPTAMIFVPSKDGLSHNPREYSTPEQCADGAQVLLNALLHYDKVLASQY